jgi:hypothetical protein
MITSWCLYGTTTPQRRDLESAFRKNTATLLLEIGRSDCCARPFDCRNTSCRQAWTLFWSRGSDQIRLLQILRSLWSGWRANWDGDWNWRRTPLTRSRLRETVASSAGDPRPDGDSDGARLPKADQSPVGKNLSFSSVMQPVLHSGRAKIRAGDRQLARSLPDQPLPSLESGRLRPSVADRAADANRLKTFSRHSAGS